MTDTEEAVTRKIIEPGGHVCGMIAHGDWSRDFMEECLSPHLQTDPPLGGEIEKGWYRWVPNRHREPREAPVLLYRAEEGSAGSFYATYLDLRK